MTVKQNTALGEYTKLLIIWHAYLVSITRWTILWWPNQDRLTAMKFYEPVVAPYHFPISCCHQYPLIRFNPVMMNHAHYTCAIWIAICMCAYENLRRQKA